MKLTLTPLSANRTVPISATQQALLDAVRTERDAMYFYLRAARTARDGRARRVFNNLAEDERRHIEWFLETCSGNDLPDLQTCLDRGRNEANGWLEELENTYAADSTDLAALELAMRKEEELEQHLRRQAAKQTDLQIKRVYLANADATHQHYETIRAELQRLSGEQNRT
ncbi:hypothetical protein C2E25_16290 [Geothermobacter hydrogeniphilus]|uniref:Rubrerythrin diiron-binding domain-containing protein n=1 Tax=Geothermobacter hydrogeniphilus TaxID=1969733 RepID=A0A2K2H621_9BACT|nr:hypothetical protein C2E25_16290 [Geothermobacter hydrogeniphilus]